MSFAVLIPARYASTRLPGKPLSDIAGKPMVVRVAERAHASGAQHVAGRNLRDGIRVPDEAGLRALARAGGSEQDQSHI